MLQDRFAIICHPALSWDIELIGKIMRAPLILHNIIVEDECDTYRSYWGTSEFDQVEENDTDDSTVPDEMRGFIGNRAQIRDTSVHAQLKSDLIKHI